MKKIAIILTLALCLSLFAGCGGNSEPALTAPEGTTEELMNKLYENVTVELPLMTMPVDLSDEFAVSTYLGMDGAGAVKEASVLAVCNAAEELISACYCARLAIVPPTCKTAHFKAAVEQVVDCSGKLVIYASCLIEALGLVLVISDEAICEEEAVAAVRVIADAEVYFLASEGGEICLIGDKIAVCFALYA